MLVFQALVAFGHFAMLAVAVWIPSNNTQTWPRHDRPALMVPTLTEVRAILARIQSPIISTLVSRAALPADPSLYADDGRSLISFTHKKEVVARSTGRYAYGSLEYPFTLPLVSPDATAPTNCFPGGRFHQDTYTPNTDLLSFYLKTLVPRLQDANAAQRTSTFFHLSGPVGAADTDAKYTLDAQLLALFSHRASLGKIIAESKYAANITGYTSLMRSRDADSIRHLLTNTTQEQIVLDGAASASLTLAMAWEGAQTTSPDISNAFVARIQAAVAEVYRELIRVTTEVEVQYLLYRLD